MRNLRAVPAILVVALLVSATPASAKSISDAREDAAKPRDIRVAKLVRPEKGTLAWTTVMWDTWSPKAMGPSQIQLDLDIKGTSAADYRIAISWDFFYEKLICQVERPSGTFVRAGTVTRPDGKSVACSFSTKGFAFDKAVHWRARSQVVGYTDLAPNSGWVVGIG